MKRLTILALAMSVVVASISAADRQISPRSGEGMPLSRKSTEYDELGFMNRKPRVLPEAQIEEPVALPKFYAQRTPEAKAERVQARRDIEGKLRDKDYNSYLEKKKYADLRLEDRKAYKQLDEPRATRRSFEYDAAYAPREELAPNRFKTLSEQFLELPQDRVSANMAESYEQWKPGYSTQPEMRGTFEGTNAQKSSWWPGFLRSDTARAKRYNEAYQDKTPNYALLKKQDVDAYDSVLNSDALDDPYEQWKPGYSTPPEIRPSEVRGTFEGVGTQKSSWWPRFLSSDTARAKRYNEAYQDKAPNYASLKKQDIDAYNNAFGSNMVDDPYEQFKLKEVSPEEIKVDAAQTQSEESMFSNIFWPGRRKAQATQAVPAWKGKFEEQRTPEAKVARERGRVGQRQLLRVRDEIKAKKPLNEQLLYMPERYVTPQMAEAYEQWRPSTNVQPSRWQRLKNYVGSQYNNWEANRQLNFNKKLQKLRHNTAGREELERLEQWR